MSKKYRTDGGFHITLFTTSARGPFPVVGLIHKEVDDVLERWRLNADESGELVEIKPWDNLKPLDPCRVRHKKEDKWSYRVYAGIRNGYPTTLEYFYDDFRVESPENLCIVKWNYCEPLSATDVELLSISGVTN